MIASLTLLVALAVSPAAGDLLPADGFAEGWSPGETERFGPSALYNHINGGAELFLELGFEELTVTRYRCGDDELVAELYRMTDALGALGIYLAKCPKETPDPLLDERHTMGVYQLVLVKDRYLLILDNRSGKDTLKPVLRSAAADTASRLPAGVVEDPFTVLPTDGLVAGSQRLIRGPLGLQSIVTLGPDDILQLDQRHVAVAASYRGDDEGVIAKILVTYDDRAGAAAALSHLTTHLDPYLHPVSHTNQRLVFRDWSGRFGEAIVDDARLRITTGLVQPPAGEPR